MAQSSTAPQASAGGADDTGRREGQPPRTPMYDDHTKVKALLERCRKDARQNTARQSRDRADLLNLRMYRGGEANHWVVWDGNANTYVERPTEGDAGLPAWFFRATSNFLANKIDGITAIENQSQPAKTFYATRDDDQSRAAADVAEMADPVLLDEISYPHDLRPRLNKLVALTNVAGLVLTYDTDPKWGMETLPLLLCSNPDCRQVVNPMDAPNEEDPCPDCGEPLDFAADPSDRSGMTPLSMDAPKGRIDAELLSSFEISLPRNAGMALEDRLPWVSSHQRWNVEDAISRWAKLKDVLKDGHNIGSSSGKATEQAYADQMRNLSSPVSAGSQPQTTGGNVATGPIIWRLWHDPIDDDEFYFPDGLFCAELEGDEIVLEASPLPFTDDDGRPFKNVLLRQFSPAPGSPWGKPPADDLVPLQKQLNLAQSLAFLILMHHASPRTFIPSSVTMHEKLSGVPGKVHTYTALRPGDKPTVEPGQSFPEGLKWFLEFIIQTFDTVSKLNAVLMGTRPQGDPTLGEVEILQERGFAAFQEPLEQLVSFEKRLSLKLLWIARESGWAPRFRRLLNEENGEWELKQFTGADLEGHVTVDIELASAWPKSPMLVNLRLNRAIETGMVDPADPEVREAYLRLNDLQDFKKSVTVDEEQVTRQLNIWKTAQAPQQIEAPQAWWRLDYHLFRKTQFLKSELFEQMRTDPAHAQVAAAMVQHVLQLKQMLQPPAPPAAPADAAPGDNGALGSAVKAGALRPAPGAGGRASLANAVHSGALRPPGTGQRVAQAARHRQGRHLPGAVASGALRPSTKRATASAAPPAVGSPNAPGAGGNPAGAQA